jgi:hypothetical protein
MNKSQSLIIYIKCNIIYYRGVLMRKIRTEVLLLKNEVRLQKMIRDNFPKKRITQQKRRVESLKEQILDNKVYVSNIKRA